MKSEKRKLILAIEASTQNWSVSILENGGELGFRTGDKINPLSEYLLPTIAELLRDADKRLPEIDLMAVTIGPGSFTGLRVALSVSQGLCYSLNNKHLGINYLEILANAGTITGDFCVFVTTPNRKIYSQNFFGIENREGVVIKSEPKIEDYNDFFNNENYFPLLTDKETGRKINLVDQNTLGKVEIIETLNLAGVLGQIAFSKQADYCLELLQPIYV